LVGHGKKRIRFERYLLEEKYKDWFDRNYPDQTIYEAVGLNEWDYNEMKKKLSPDQTVEEKSKTEPEPELESESKIETKSTDTSKIPPTQPAVSEEQQNITKKRTNMLFWLRIGLALIGGASATFLFEGIEDTEEHRWSSIIFMIVLFIITCFIAKGMKINFPKSDRKKLVTTGIGSFIFMYLFAWIMTYTLLNLPRDDLSLPFT